MSDLRKYRVTLCINPDSPDEPIVTTENKNRFKMISSYVQTKLRRTFRAEVTEDLDDLLVELNDVEAEIVASWYNVKEVSLDS